MKRPFGHYQLWRDADDSLARAGTFVTVIRYHSLTYHQFLCILNKGLTTLIQKQYSRYITGLYFLTLPNETLFKNLITCFTSSHNLFLNTGPAELLCRMSSHVRTILFILGMVRFTLICWSTFVKFMNMTRHSTAYLNNVHPASVSLKTC